MRYSLASLALAALAVASPMPQGVTSAISPQGTTPAGCSSSYSGTFQIQVVNVTKSSSKAKRQQDDGALILTLEGGILKDSKDRTGYIAANRQFQFDGPPQTGAVYTAGWSVCSNGSLAIGPDAIFYQCLSGTFYNLYDEAEAAQCSQVYIQAIGSGSSSGAASQSADGQVTASPVSSAASEQSDGQVTASPVPTTAAPVSQITDGQVQASTGASAAPVSQISDGQIQATTAAPAPTTPVAPVTQITDGQIQAPTSTANPVTQISDGQIQAPTGANTTVASPTASVVPYTGGAMPIAIRSEFFALAAGVLAVALL